ncbi:MAG: hypothetical protein H7Y31_02145 [Chitinophagaceae bacterium]|nr:hypothetical protein [Chitinophagaceae bacterium]
MCLVCLAGYSSIAQVSTVEFGKNRVQYRKFKWQYLQTNNFNTYFYEDGKTIANYVLQVAEKELPEIEQFVEYGLQRRANIVIYNHFNEMEQSNIGLNTDWQTAGGITKLVNNKMIVYFNGNHADLRRQIRQGIARTLVENILFGDDLGEFAANQTLLDLPKWLVDGYIDYVAEDWNPQLDDELKSALLSGEYKNFYQFAHEKPLLAGHAFWYYFANKHKKENVTYFLYLARVYRNLNSASQRIAKMKFKDVLKAFMVENEELYAKDLRGRRDIPKGTVSIVEEVSKNRDFLHFSANPAPRSMTYAVVEYIKGQYCVVLYENMVDRKVLLKTGVRVAENEINPNYPLLAWDGKGTRLACVYWSGGQTKLFVYDLIARFKPVKQDLTHFEQVQDMKFMLNSNTLLLSAVRKGQPDIFVYDIEKDKFEQVTNDAYADLDASFVAFPNKQGILFSSNRPNPYATGADTGYASNRFNVFLADNYSKNEFRQISQLTNLKFGNARYPMQYNTSHFTFISDETGISNRFAGFFSTERAGLDSVYVVGEEFLRNPDDRELDSTLKAWGKTEPDSVFAYSVTNDSAYVFPITNYQSALKETKIAGDNGQVSEVRQQGNLKFLYRLKVDETTLRRRNINPRPTDYRKQTIADAQLAEGEQIDYRDENKVADTSSKAKDFFDTGFESEKEDSIRKAERINEATEVESVLKRAKLFDYKLKFAADNFSAAFNNDVLINRYQPYTGSLPVILQSGGAFNGMLKASVFDLFEDIRFSGAVRLPLIGGTGTGASIGGGGGGVGVYVPVNQSLFDGGGEWYARVDYLKRRMDYSFIYYRQTNIGAVTGINGNNKEYEAKQFSNLYQGVIKYPLDRVRSIRISAGVRMDKYIIRAANFDSSALTLGDINKQTFALARIEWIHDNAIMKTTNIMNGFRYKVYADVMSQINEPRAGLDLKKGAFNFNLGADVRYYYPIFRNFIWAGRAAADFSLGEQKIIYYLGGVDGWMFPKYSEKPSPNSGAGASNFYAYQSLAVNLRGFPQNAANGNNAFILNSEFRLPVFATLFNRPINNAFLRNFQLIQFFDLGSAWSGSVKNIERPFIESTAQGTPVSVLVKAGGIGPFAGGYGFGVRSTLLGYFLRLDAGWEMNSFFKGKPMLHFAMGIDF